MSARELTRVEVLSRVKAGTLSLGSAATLLAVSYRQAKRLVGRWMLTAGLWSRARKHAPHRQRRERKAHFGELVQLDGSFHVWYEARGPRGCLMNLVDDATGQTLARLGTEETIWAAVGVLRRWIEAYGVPLALYTDWKNVYVRVPTAREQGTGRGPLTEFA